MVCNYWVRVPPPGEILDIPPTAEIAGGSVSTIFSDDIAEMFLREKTSRIKTVCQTAVDYSFQMFIYTISIQYISKSKNT